MGIRVTHITEGKYMDSEIDTITFSFASSVEESLVDELDVGDDSKYMIFTSEGAGTGELKWVMFVNPIELVKDLNAYIPEEVDFDVEYSGETQGILSLLRKMYRVKA